MSQRSTTPTMSESVDVDVDPATAFAVFTDEIEQWWGNGPIDAWDSARTVGRRIEPGVGGRLLGLRPGAAPALIPGGRAAPLAARAARTRVPR